MGFIIGGIVCVLYAAVVYFIAVKRPPAIMRIMKKKLGGKISDNGAAIVAYIFASIALAGGIVLFVLPGVL
jgi:hypothetical protein